MIDLLFINYYRPACTKLALPALLAGPHEEFSLTIWDNGSTDGTREYLSSVEVRRIIRKVFSEDNVRIHGAVNKAAQNSSAELFTLFLTMILLLLG